MHAVIKLFQHPEIQGEWNELPGGTKTEAPGGILSGIMPGIITVFVTYTRDMQERGGKGGSSDRSEVNYMQCTESDPP